MKYNHYCLTFDRSKNDNNLLKLYINSVENTGATLTLVDTGGVNTTITVTAPLNQQIYDSIKNRDIFSGRTDKNIELAIGSYALFKNKC